LSLSDIEIITIFCHEERLDEIEKEFHKFSIWDVKCLEQFLVDENNVNGLYIKVGPYYSSKERQKVITDVKLWLSKLDYKELMRIKNTSLIRKQVKNREFNKYATARASEINELSCEINQIKLNGWSDSFFSFLPNKNKYEMLLAERLQKLDSLQNVKQEPWIKLLNEILDVADVYEKEIYDLDKEIENIKKTANLRDKEFKLKAKLAKAARVDEKIRAEAPTFRKSIKKTEFCPYCSSAIGSRPHLDHIYPVSKGGLNLDDNLVYCCQSCNSKKSDKSLRQFCIENNFSYLEVTDRLALLGKHV
jgi:5-methylcytosine-specific restriction endonuclease McrA